MRKFLICCLMILPLVVVGCSKGPAEAALKAADEAIAKVKPEAEKFVPDQFKALTEAAATAKANFDKGDYAAALAAAKDLPAKATEVATAATAKKDELMGQWNELSKDIPAKMLDLTDKVNALAAMKKLPMGVDAAKIDEIKTRLADMNSHVDQGRRGLQRRRHQGRPRDGRQREDLGPVAAGLVRRHHAEAGRQEVERLGRAPAPVSASDRDLPAGLDRRRPRRHRHVCARCERRGRRRSGWRGSRFARRAVRTSRPPRILTTASATVTPSRRARPRASTAPGRSSNRLSSTAAAASAARHPPPRSTTLLNSTRSPRRPG